MHSRALADSNKIVALSPEVNPPKTSSTKSRWTSKPEQQSRCQFHELSDGRQIAFSEYGKVDGIPVFYFHSTGSSRIECRLFHSSAKRLGFRLIAVDRPGIGYSDFKPQLRLKETAVDILELADRLGLQKFGLMSFATGGIFALSMAFYFPKRVSFQLSLGGIPGNLVQEVRPRKSFTADCIRSLLPSLVRQFTRFRHKFTTDSPSAEIARLQEMLNYTDKKVLSDPEIHSIIRSSMEESLRQGFQGVAQDKGLSYSEPGFQLRQIRVPVSIWQGCADNLQPRSSSEYLAARIPSASFHTVANRGHYFFVHCMDEIFTRTKSIAHA